MAQLTKRQRAISEVLTADSENGQNQKIQMVYTAEQAVSALQALPPAGFPESVDAAFRLGVDPRKSDQMVRGSTVLPHGTGKTIRVAVFTQGDNVEKAKAAGADIVGLEDLAQAVKKGEMDFDVVIASPDAMRVVGQLGQILGPRGLMPNPKVGTVSVDVATAVKNAKAGQVRYRTEKSGIVHCTVGKIGFTVDQLVGNLKALLADLRKLKPAAAKGVYIRKITLSTTMGPGLTIDPASLDG